MKNNGFLAWFIAISMVVLILLLSIYVFQMNNLEQRIESQVSQITKLGDSADRLRAEVQKMSAGMRSGAFASGPATTTATVTGSSFGRPDPERKWLHPEVKDLLEPMDFVMTSPEAEMNGTLTRWYGPEPKGFNIMIENAADLQEYVMTYVVNLLANRMPWTDPNKWYGELAERVEILDDYKEFIIYLRKGVKWHKPGGVNLDGERYAWLRGDHYLTAKDVIFSFDILMNPQVQNGFIKNYFEELDSWEAIDDYTIRVRWKKKQYGNLEQTMSAYIIPEFLWSCDENGRPFPKETLGVNFNDHWYGSKGMVGTGPYRMASYEPGVVIKLERNEDYFGPLPAIKNINWDIFSDPDGVLLRMKAHKENYGGLRPGQYYDLIKKWETVEESKRPADSPFLNGKIKNDTYLGMVYYYIGWNADKPMFKNKMTRRAMTIALDRAGFIQNVLYGLGEVATGPFYPKGPYPDPDITAWPFDLAEAKKILKEVGWEDSDGDGLLDMDLNPDDGVSRRTPFEFSLLSYAGSPEFEALANIFREDLLEIGVRMNVETVEWSLMQKRMDDKTFDAFTGGWGLTWEPDPYQLWHSSQADIPKGSNRVGFRNKEADEIIEQLRDSFDLAERIKLCHRFHQIMHEEQPYTFFWVREYAICWWDEIQRMVLSKYRPQSNSLPWWIEAPRLQK